LILITGATGLIGSHLTCRLIGQGKNIIALKRENSNLKNLEQVAQLYSITAQQLQQIQWVQGDLSDIFSLIDAMQGVEEVYHCAGLVSFDKKHRDSLQKINSEGSANMINAALECGIKKFCHVSSVATLPNHDNKKIVDENIYWKSSPANSCYAISKYGGEREAWRGVEEGLNVVIVNPAVVLGAGCYGQSSSRLIDECYKGIKVYTEGVAGYIDVRDVVTCMISLMERGKFGQRYVLSAENMAFSSVFNLFHDAFGRPHAKYKAGKNMLAIGTLLDSVCCSFSGKERRLTPDISRAALEKSYFSNEKIKNVLPIQFIPIKETVAYIAADFLQRLTLSKKQ
jgi:dihydroflavonol-4-reductase